MKVPKGLQMILWIAGGIGALSTILGAGYKGYNYLHELEHQQETVRKNQEGIIKILERYPKDSLKFDKWIKSIEKRQRLDSTYIYYNYYWVKRWAGQ